MAKRVIFSDLHFGDPACSLGRRPIVEKLCEFLQQFCPDELIFAGDIIDLDISTYTKSICGDDVEKPQRLGFRDFLTGALGPDRCNPKSIVYVPGNHDYDVWDQLAKEIFFKSLSEGVIPPPTGAPMISGAFDHPFVRGAFPRDFRDKVRLEYPDYRFRDGHGQVVLVTHGHYVDRIQTGSGNISRLVDAAAKQPPELDSAIRDLFIATAQYEDLAHLVSYTSGWRNAIYRVMKFFDGLEDRALKEWTKPIGSTMAKDIDIYVEYWKKAPDKPDPDVFVFGHTHKPTHDSLYRLRGAKNCCYNKNLDIWNIGCFIEATSSNRAGTFVTTESDANGQQKITLFEISLNGVVRPI